MGDNKEALERAICYYCFCFCFCCCWQFQNIILKTEVEPRGTFPLLKIHTTDILFVPGDLLIERQSKIQNSLHFFLSIHSSQWDQHFLGNGVRVEKGKERKGGTTKGGGFHERFQRWAHISGGFWCRCRCWV